MVKNSTEISGKAMAVIVGIICLVAPWFGNINFFSKLIISIIGIVLIYLGTK